MTDTEEPAAATSADTHGKERNRRAFKTTLTALAGRGLGMLLSLVSLPLTVGYLDAERYGMWVTVGSLIAWLTIADLGLGNGLSNAVTTARAQGDHEAARRAVSTAFVLVSSVALAMMVVFAVSFPFVPWARVFALSAKVDQHELRVTVALCLAAFALGFPLGLVDRVLGACQEGYVSNYWASASAVASTVALVLAVRFASGLPTLVVALSGVPLAMRFITALWVFTKRHPELRPTRRGYSRAMAGTLLATGTTFLVAQMAALGMLQTDNIIIAQISGAAAVGPYAVAFRIAGIVIALAGMWLGPLWPAYADAAARGDYGWIRASVRRTTRLGLLGAIAAAGGMLVLGQWFIRVWTRKPEMVPSRRLLMAMGVYVILVVHCQVFAMALNGLNRLRWQMVYGIAAAGVNVVLSIVLGRWMGVDGVCWATDIAVTIPAVLAPVELYRVLREADAGKADGPPSAGVAVA